MPLFHKGRECYRVEVAAQDWLHFDNNATQATSPTRQMRVLEQPPKTSVLAAVGHLVIEWWPDGTVHVSIR